MTFDEVRALIDRIDGSGLTEFELRLDNAYIRMGKNGVTAENTPRPAPAVETAPPFAEAPAAPPPNPGPVVKAPIVGTFYAAPAPDKPNFVSVGDAVKKGDVLCIVEAMKVMNEIKSEFDGRITEICAENGQMVEYGQPLFRLS